MTEKKQFNRIVGDDVVRLPRLGKIKMGLKLDTGGTRETDYFVCPPEVQSVFGDQPQTLEIVFPVDDPLVAYREAYKWYGAGAIKCFGNGEDAMRRVDCLTAEQRTKMAVTIEGLAVHEMVEVECPCPLLESRQCKLVGSYTSYGWYQSLQSALAKAGMK